MKRRVLPVVAVFHLNYWQKSWTTLTKLTRILPVVKIESSVSHPRPHGAWVILMVFGCIGCLRREDYLVLVKVDTNLEGSGEAAN